VGQQVWIALTTAVVAALGTYLGYRQTESALTKFNQAATDLSNVRGWWHSLSPEEQLLPSNIDLLVDYTEQVLQTELDGWVQQMQNALADLHKNQALQAERTELKAQPEEQPTTSATPATGAETESAPVATVAATTPADAETSADLDPAEPGEADAGATAAPVAGAASSSTGRGENENS
jgi:hypothetical protein